MLSGLRVWSFLVEPDKDMATLRDLPSANTGSPLKDQACETLWGDAGGLQSGIPLGLGMMLC